MAITLKGILGTVAPVLASALPGPLGGMARKVVSDALGAPEKSSDADLVKALNASTDPATLLKLKQAEADFAAKMKELDIDLEKLAADDRASARAMQVSTRSKTAPILACVIVGLWGCVMASLLFHLIPEGNRDVVMRALGILDSSLLLVLGFYFGSSMSSRTKDETIERLSS